jgi:hypothetical protein
MFSRFLTDQGTRFIRTEYVISIADVDGRCHVIWLVGDDVATQLVHGTAQENFDRLKAEELELIAAAAERQGRADRGLPLLPIPRGRTPR